MYDKSTFIYDNQENFRTNKVVLESNQGKLWECFVCVCVINNEPTKKPSDKQTIT